MPAGVFSILSDNFFSPLAKKINTWLDEQGGTEKILFPSELIRDEDSYIRFVYSLLYGDSRNNFGYAVEETQIEETLIGKINEEQANLEFGEVSAAGYVVPDVRFRRKHESRP